MESLESLLPVLSELAGTSLQNSQVKQISGGSINAVFRVVAPDKKAFCCKVNSATKFPHLFMREAEGLKHLSPYITTPGVIGTLQWQTTQVLLLQWIDSTAPTPLFWRRFGEALAQLHSITGPYFGFYSDNYMGAVLQQNEPLPNWNAFFSQRRLMPLARLCSEKKLLGNNERCQIEKLCDRLPDVFDASIPRLIHGDLWSGNFLCDTNQNPVLIDPAVYYGHPAADLGMTTLFGGFDALFYKVYQHHIPFPANCKEQWEVCNLYPLLVHLLLFGKSYYPQVKATLAKYGL